MKFETEVLSNNTWQAIMKFDSDEIRRCVARAPVFGGWIVHNWILQKKYSSTSESMVFIPDPNHEWTIDE